MLCLSCHLIPLKPLTLRTVYAKSLDALTSLSVSHAILPCAVCFATSRPANHATCSFIDTSGYASRTIRICLFIDYVINNVMTTHFITSSIGAQWLSGRVLDLRPRGRGFEPHRRCCCVLEQEH